MHWHTSRTSHTVSEEVVVGIKVRGCCSSPSAFCRCWCRNEWPRVSCGCSMGVEQSATTDQGRLLATDISAGDQLSVFHQSFGWQKSGTVSADWQL